jgi:Domain of unknown function (DUF4082)/Bacterial Ig-like domain (group 2)
MAMLAVTAGLAGYSVAGAGAAAAATTASLWPSTAVPTVIDSGDGSAVELGVAFTSQVSGSITGVRFYKAAANTGVHVGSLWTSTGTLLAQATFTNESGSGWQDVTFAAPVGVTANTVYVAGYHTNTGHYSDDKNFFTNGSYTNGLLTAPGGSASNPNGLFTYSATPTFPSNTFNGSNYWVDVDFSTAPPPPPACPCSLWAPTVTPVTVDSGDGSAVELGVQFTPAVNGFITGVRYYKSAANTGDHIGSLWSYNGSPTLLAQATFTSESATGWQQVTFPSPIAVTAGTVYVAGYHTNTGHYSVDKGYFSNGGYSNPPLTAPGGPGNPNGLYAYSPTPTFPNGTFNGNNYWVDVVFTSGKTPVSITLGGMTANPPKGTTEQLSATEAFSDGSTTDVTSQVTWGSSNPSVASVSPSGLLSALNIGSTQITASIDGLTGSAGLTVAPPALTAITVSAPSTSLPSGVSEQLTATGTYTDASTANLTSQVKWGSSSSALSVSSTGLATGASQGPATATATLGSVTGSLGVTVLAPIGYLYVQPLASAVSAGQSEQLSVMAWLTNGTTANVTALAQWSTLPWSPVSISPTGVATGNAPGVGVIYATVGHCSAVGIIIVNFSWSWPWH